MLERDYFIRILQEFEAAVQAFLEKNEGKQKDTMLKELYHRYLGKYELLRNMTLEEAIGYAQDNWKEEERIERLEMLAQLWYYEGDLMGSKPLRDLLLDKAFTLLDYVDQRSSTYSMSRKQKMVHIRQLQED
jgi:type I site-specific restriction-modification system R (restriction) subunit